MQRVAPGVDFEAYTSGFDTGLAGTIGVRLRDGQGADAIARTTIGIAEDIAGSGIYRVTLNAPDDQGQYWLIWDDDDGTYAAPEELLVTASLLGPAVPSGRDLCALADVLALAPGYTPGDEPGTEDVLQQLITQESLDFMEETDREITSAAAGGAVRTFDVDHATVDERELLIGDAADITSVTIKDGDGNTLDAAPVYRALPRVKEAWEPLTSIVFPVRTVTGAASLRAGQMIEIDAAWGFPQIPETVRRSTARMVISRFLNDVAAEGTAFADAVNRDEFNIAAAWAAALDVRRRYRIPSIG